MTPSTFTRPGIGSGSAALLSPGRFTVGVAWAGLLMAAVPPRDGGMGFCWVHTGTGVPCPGCGMTRSLGHAVRGDLGTSWQYHPFGLPLLVLFVGIAALSLLPQAYRLAVSGWFGANAIAARRGKVVFLSLFIGYGVVRALLQVLHLHDFEL